MSKSMWFVIIALVALLLVGGVIAFPHLKEYESIHDKKTGEDIVAGALDKHVTDYAKWFEEHGYTPPIRIGPGKDGNIHTIGEVMKAIDHMYLTKGSAFVGEAWDLIWAEYGYKAPKFIGNATPKQHEDYEDNSWNGPNLGAL